MSDLSVSGGVIEGIDGVKLAVPPGSVSQDTSFLISRDAENLDIPDSVTLLSHVYSVVPHGQEFNGLAHISIPFDSSALGPDQKPFMIHASPDGYLEVIPSAVEGATLTADTSSLSFFAVGVCNGGVQADCPTDEHLVFILEDPTTHQDSFVQRDGNGIVQPVQTFLDAAKTLNFRVGFTRPSGTARTDSLSLSFQGGTIPISVNSYEGSFTSMIRATNAAAWESADGQIVNVTARVSVEVEAFNFLCACMHKYYWYHTAVIPIRFKAEGTPPHIITAPVTQSVEEGQTTTFSVAATGVGLSYQWQRMPPVRDTPPAGGYVWQNIPGATGTSYTTPATTVLADNSARYKVEICTHEDSTGTSPREACIPAFAELFVRYAGSSNNASAPNFTVQPESITAFPGQTVSVTAVATGNPPPYIFWEVDRPCSGTFCPGGYTMNWSEICGFRITPPHSDPARPTEGTTSTCILPATFEGRVRAVAVTTVSEASLNSLYLINDTPKSYSNEITITRAPSPIAATVSPSGALADKTVDAGGSVSWTVNAEGTAPISYRWYQPGHPSKIHEEFACPGNRSEKPRAMSVHNMFNGETTFSLSLIPASCNGLQVALEMTNPAGAVSTRTATLTVNNVTAVPVITTALADQSVNENEPVAFFVTATGYPLSDYAWTFDGTAMTACDHLNTCGFKATASQNGKTMHVDVSNAVGLVSSEAVLTVVTTTIPDPTPTDTTPPTVSVVDPIDNAHNVSVNTNVSVTFSETIDCTTLTNSSFTLNNGAAVSGNVSCSNDTATFTPASPLAAGTEYTATITAVIGDMAGNHLAADHSWKFTTETKHLVFSATNGMVANGANGVELWTTDGTGAGTQLVQDINPGSNSSPYGFTWLNTEIIFTANDGSHGIELWKSNGTAAGTTLVKDIKAPGSSYPGGFAVFGNMVFFYADDGIHGTELWKTDGTEAGTTLVKDISPGSNGSGARYFTVYKNELYFQANDGSVGMELWKTDGTETGTVLVHDIFPGTVSSDPSKFIVYNDELYFQAGDDTHGVELWKTNGTDTVLVKDINPAGSSNAFNNAVVAGTTLFFSADDGFSGNELWKTDGTESGTVQVKDINSGAGNSYPYRLTAMNNIVLFGAEQITGNRELWRSDGTVAGTVLVKEINPSGSADPMVMTNSSAIIGNVLYFAANDGTHGTELWQSDGTEGGTVMIKEFMSGAGSGNPANFLVFDGALYFNAWDGGILGTELWKSDGTTGGTVLVKDICPLDCSSTPSFY